MLETYLPVLLTFVVVMVIAAGMITSSEIWMVGFILLPIIIGFVFDCTEKTKGE